MKRTTYFRPSIHGWPFGNSWDWTITFPFPQFELNLNSVGFCGGMCWTALDKFYQGICIPRDIGAPAQGAALYNEIEQAQVQSVVDVGKLYKMYEWQMSPRLGGHWGNPHRSLGSRTLEQWSTLRTRFSDPSPHGNRPVTLTLIRTANDYDPTHLVQHHRIVAYGFEERELEEGEYVRGNANERIRHVKLYIYDPNYTNDDDVYLTFYTNCDDDWIRLRHSKGNRATGFFVDDMERDYLSDDDPDLQIQALELSDITSASRADFDLRFRWKCRVIPYFCIQVNGADWGFNQSVQQTYLPVGNIKQCPAKEESMAIRLELPRAPSTVDVRFLEDDSLTASKDVSLGEPYFRCLPRYWRPNETIREQHFYFADRDPSKAALEQLSSPPSRTVRVRFPAAWTDSEVAFPWAEWVDDAGNLTPDFFETHLLGDPNLPTKRYLGNVAKALYADFLVQNLASPTEISATVTTITNGQTTATRSLSSLPNQDALLFSGFSPSDYNDDTEVRIALKCTDGLGLVLQDQVSLHGRSILEFSQSRLYPELPPILRIQPSGSAILEKTIAKYEAAALRLVEMGLLDLKAELAPPPVRRPTDPVALLTALRLHRRLQGMIGRSSRGVWHDPRRWNECLKHHSEVLSREYQTGVTLHHSLDKTDRMTALREQEAEIQRRSEAVIIGAFAGQIVQDLRRNPDVLRELESLP